MSAMEQLMEKTQLSRRKFLQVAGALSASATLYGCSGGGDGSQGAVVAQDNLVLDKEMKTVMSCHPFNCGSRCTFKFYVKNGRMIKLTSAGDIPRADSTAADEAVDLVQRRSCQRGYAQIKRQYQPDRLKYPMKQTLERGNLNGFKRISWEEAYTTIADQYKIVTARKDKLGYIPAFGGYLNYFGVVTSPQGAPSFENYFNCKYGAIGINAENSYAPDILNSKLIINWAVDATVSFSWQPHIFWWLTKAKEKGIPIITVEANTTDSVTTLSTGYPNYNLPAYLSVRVESDAAILSAMANVIYRKNLHDVAFINQYCFGFYKGDTVVSQATGSHPITKKAYAGQTFTTPTGMSFVEYLDDLEAKNGGYAGVLKWASDLSGLTSDNIEKLAIAYGSTKPAFLYGGWGVCRTGNGMHVMWLLIALAAMTGNTNKRGGGAGFANWVSSSMNVVSLGGNKLSATTAKTSGSIAFSVNCTGKLIMNGLDNRAPEQLRADALNFSSVDLGAWKTTRDDVNGNDGRLRVEMIAFGPNQNFVNQKGPINPLLLAIKKRDIVKFTYGIDNFMTPSMAMCDIILPQTTHLEESRIDTGAQWTTAFMFNKVIEPMYECKTSYEIQSEILHRLGIDYGIYGPRGNASDLDLIKEQWAGAKIGSRYATVNPNATLPSFEEFSAAGVLEFPVPTDQAFLGSAVTTDPGKYVTDTGRINFFSPYYFYRDQALGAKFQKPDGGYYRTRDVPKAMYARPIEGYSDILEGKLNAKGIKYTLQMKTSHNRRRVHSTYDNVALLKEQFPGILIINAIDAAARGISNRDVVYAYNDFGCIKVQCIVTKRIRQGVINVSDGEWYRASTSETYEAWIDMNGDGTAEKYVVPVDVGGAPNTLMHHIEMGPMDPVTGYTGDNNWNGHLVEVSKTHPDKK